MQNESVYLSNWLLVLTTLPAKDWTSQKVLSLYRARWQIELLFKRIKQLLRAHRLRPRTEKTARATLAAILVSWVLQQGMAIEIRSFILITCRNGRIGDGSSHELTGAARVGIHPVLLAGYEESDEDAIRPDAEVWQGPSISLFTEVLKLI